MGHSWSKGWDTKPRAKPPPPEEPKTARAKKDRRHWCRGKVGVEHRPVVVLSKDWSWFEGSDRDQARCYWWWQNWRKEWVYTCAHVSQCAECGKMLASKSWQRSLGHDCPDFAERHDGNTGAPLWRRLR